MPTTNTNLSTPHTPSSFPPHSKGIKRKFLGFTLVELIVVITILVILGTIAFLNLGGFAGSARDSARISNLANLQKGLNLYQVKTGTYPTPESSVAITASGVTIGYQGFAKDIIGGIAKISKGGTVDPSDSSIFTTYAVNATQTKMQAMVFLEDSSNVTAYEEIPPTPLTKGGIIAFFNPLIKGVTSEASWGIPGVDTTYAATTTDYSKRFPKTSGDSLGILLSTATGTLNQPVQESGTGVDLAKTTTLSGYALVFSKTDTTANTIITGSGAYTGSLFTFAYNKREDLLKDKTFATNDSSLVGYWDMETTIMSGSQVLLKDLSGNGNNGVTYGGLVIGGVAGLGKGGQGMYFDGVDDWISVSNSQFLNLPTSDFSVVSVIQTTQTGNQRCIVSTSFDGTTGFRYGYGFSQGQPYYLYGGYTEGYITSGININDNKPHHLVMNYFLNKKITSFVDGVYVGMVDISGFNYGNKGALNLSQQIDIGTVHSGGGGNINGTLDEVRIYNRALSDSEIQTLYNATK